MVKCQHLGLQLQRQFRAAELQEIVYGRHAGFQCTTNISGKIEMAGECRREDIAGSGRSKIETVCGDHPPRLTVPGNR